MRIGRALYWLVVTLFIGFAVACGSPRGGKARAPRGGGPIQEVHLFGFPVALNTDRTPGPDVVGIRIYASNRATARGLPITKGELEVLMLPAGTPSPGQQAPGPLRTWRFKPNELKANEGMTAIGVGYKLALPLGSDIPNVSAVTIVARYVDPAGKVVSSSPSTISLLTQ
ncbi:MAG TPA: hypothetical protein VEH27_05790 [Methylomirabilota bacterium]|nr:hypothetical protein [Methylomirabilota bacterium]